MEVNIDVVVVWLAMVAVAMFSYAVVIPYFIVRRIRRMVASGEMAEMLVAALESPVRRPDGTETTVAALMVSVAVANLKNQFNSLKSAVVRGFASSEDGTVDDAMQQYLASVPARWRWIVPLALPLLSRVAPASQATAATARTVAVGVTHL